VKLTTHMYLVLRLGMSGVTLTLRHYTLFAWTGKFHVYLTCCFNIKSVQVAKLLQLKTFIIKLKPALRDKSHL